MPVSYTHLDVYKRQDLCREVHVSHEVDFMTASSYGSGMSTTRDVKILKDLDEDIRGKDVLIRCV